MRITIAILVGLVALAAVTVQAAPFVPKKALPPELGADPPIERVAQGCGYGWHRTNWHDRWGYWHWGQRVPNW